jgi:hypothetical protein
MIIPWTLRGLAPFLSDPFDGKARTAFVAGATLATHIDGTQTGIVHATLHLDGRKGHRKSWYWIIVIIGCSLVNPLRIQ